MNVQKNSLNNTLLSFFLYATQFLSSFIMRKIIIYYIGLEILGVNSVLVDTVSMLSLCELGIQTSIIYKMYEAVSKSDKCRQNQLYALFRQAYKYIGIIILIVGVCALPFLKIVVNTSLDFMYVVYIYLLQVMISASNYLLSCPRLLYLATQKQSVYLKLDIIASIITIVLQIIAIIFAHSYVLYVIAGFFKILYSNLILKKRSRLDFSYISNSTKPSFADLKDVLYDIKDIIIGSVATFVYTSTDNYIISYEFGALLLAFIVNYKTITNAIKTLIEMFSNMLSPVWGAYLNSGKSKVQILKTVRAYNFVEFIICSFLLIPVASLGNNIITVWLGAKYVIDQKIIYLIIFDLYLNAMQQSYCMVMRTYGMFKADKINNIIAATINLAASLILSRAIGVYGILVGTIIALCYYNIARMRIALIRLESMEMAGRLLIENVMFLSTFILLLALGNGVNRLYSTSYLILDLFTKTTIMVAVGTSIIVLLYHQSENFVYLRTNVIAPIMKRKHSREDS